MNPPSYVWKIICATITVLLFLPIVALFYTSLGDSDQVFTHLMATVMPIYILNTFVLIIGVAVISLIFAVPSAWFIAMCQFPGHKVLQWALVLPLAMPAYIVGYIYTDWFDYAGPIQMTLRYLTQWQATQYWFPDMRTPTGAIWVLSLTLYPYIYLLARNAFLSQGAELLQSARLLNVSPWQSFYRLTLPMAWPYIAIGLSLVAMETLGDFGAVSYFSVATLTTAIYDTWLGMSSLNAAAKIASIMLICIIVLISLERYSRRRLNSLQTKFNPHTTFKYVLTGWKKWGVTIWCWGLLTLAFILPFMQLCIYAYQYFMQSWTNEFQQYALNSLYISALVGLLALLVALILNTYHRFYLSFWSTFFLRFSSMGYATPGTVLAIAVMIPVFFVEHRINDLLKYLEQPPWGLIISGSSIALIFALVVRFVAVAIGSIEGNLQKIPHHLDYAARITGNNIQQTITRIHLPLMHRGILIAFLLVFIESMKELNASLLLRPFNFETLATYVYNFASDEQLELAAMPAILLVMVGLLPLIIINRSLERLRT